MIHTVVVLEEDHVVAAEYGTLKNSFHKLLSEAEEIHCVLDLDDLCNVIVRGKHLKRTAEILNSLAVVRPCKCIEVGIVVLVMCPHLKVPVPLNCCTDKLGGEAVADEGSFLAFNNDCAEVILHLDEVGEACVVACVACYASYKALVKVDNDKLVITLVCAECCNDVKVNKVSVLVTLNTLENSLCGFIIIACPCESVVTREVQLVVIAAIHVEEEALTLQFAAVCLAELIDCIKTTRIISEIQNRSSPFILFDTSI